MSEAPMYNVKSSGDLTPYLKSVSGFVMRTLTKDYHVLETEFILAGADVERYYGELKKTPFASVPGTEYVRSSTDKAAQTVIGGIGCGGLALLIVAWMVAQRIDSVPVMVFFSIMGVLGILMGIGSIRRSREATPMLGIREGGIDYLPKDLHLGFKKIQDVISVQCVLNLSVTNDGIVIQYYEDPGKKAFLLIPCTNLEQSSEEICRRLDELRNVKAD